MRTHHLLICLVVVGCFFVCGGCKKWHWTHFEFTNRSPEKLYVEVHGVNPDPSPGVMAPSSDGDGSRAGTHFGDPVTFENMVKISWTAGNDPTKMEQVFKRGDIDIPPKVRAGTIRVVYTPEGIWEVSYSE